MAKKDINSNYEVVIIGGGASGMMAAIKAAETLRSQSNKGKVIILEKNSRLGFKLSITGGGRCNITNATFNVRDFLKKFGKSSDYLFSTFSQFDIQDSFDFFEKNGLALETQARNRVFPKSQKATDVVKFFEKLLRKNKVDISLGDQVIKINPNEDRTLIETVETKNKIYKAKKFILSTGGTSHPETGSTGDAFKWLKKIDHNIQNPTPNIVPLKVKDQWVKSIPGTSLSFMKISFFVDGEKSFSKTGKILFTHFGLSGPLILNSAKQVSDLLHAGQVTAKIDCYPDTDLGSLEKQILKIFDKHKNKSLKNVLKEISPAGLEKALWKIIPDELLMTKIHSIKKEDRKYLVKTLKGLELEIEGLMGMDKAVISDGGVPLKEINTKTMQSKLYPNLYLIGDILHVNRPSGGYSLQLCWTTGYVAGLLNH